MAVITIGDDGLETRLAPTPQAPSFAPVPTIPGFAVGLATPNSNVTVTRDAAAGQGVSLTSGGYLPITAPATALIILTADPSQPTNGQFWVRGDLNEFRWREGGVTYKVAGTAV